MEYRHCSCSWICVWRRFLTLYYMCVLSAHNTNEISWNVKIIISIVRLKLENKRKTVYFCASLVFYAQTIHWFCWFFFQFDHFIHYGKPSVRTMRINDFTRINLFDFSMGKYLPMLFYLYRLGAESRWK